MYAAQIVRRVSAADRVDADGDGRWRLTPRPGSRGGGAHDGARDGGLHRRRRRAAVSGGARGVFLDEDQQRNRFRFRIQARGANEGRRERAQPRLLRARYGARPSWRGGDASKRRREAQDEERGGGGGVPRRRRVFRVPSADPKRRVVFTRVVRRFWRRRQKRSVPLLLRHRQRTRRVQRKNRFVVVRAGARASPAREFRAHPRARRPFRFARKGPFAPASVPVPAGSGSRARQELPVRQAPERARGSRPRVPRDGVDEDPGDVQGRAPRRVPGGVEFGPERGQRGGEARLRDPRV
mmetsp:Transcript_10430/g.44386  ORF Transcript_10430/g.44386 Transcript_10430/m.44386 type:complete len:296 (-) Transcript_10430:1141-2028(-)